jgi:pimeloyl-ACP methyl ester carboxylesterase
VLVAHSFGGSVAVAFARAHPERVRGIVFVDTNADAQAAFTHQLATLADEPAFEEHHPALRALMSRGGPIFPRLIDAYRLVGVEAAQRRLQWHDEAARQENRQLRADAPLGACSDERLVTAYQREGYLDGARVSELGAPLPVPAVVFAGRHSDTIGPSLARDAARWGAQVVWFEASAHFPFLEERPRFVEALEAFVASLDPTSPPP